MSTSKLQVIVMDHTGLEEKRYVECLSFGVNGHWIEFQCAAGAVVYIYGAQFPYIKISRLDNDKE